MGGMLELYDTMDARRAGGAPSKPMSPKNKAAPIFDRLPSIIDLEISRRAGGHDAGVLSQVARSAMRKEVFTSLRCSLYVVHFTLFNVKT